ncbi:hypothetical protein AWB81_08418 [Caballeronia arationis]|jgi:hypothetical protein|uniref:Uncharacterized protein n=1 Tax=Caballeronia arationis TaxID=1777142 RepID=A0A7Z7I2P6_9BURK|nr:hypothetical protein AWB81_08418 [Caballeronia arationis]SOE55933.1 hypothetical protein SAMN05446927_1124 [Caballeronia arationis]
MFYPKSVSKKTGGAADFVADSRFAYSGVAGEHSVHDTQIKRLRHLNFFQHVRPASRLSFCFTEVVI